MSRPLADIAMDMRIVRGPAEYQKPLNVGLLFFNEAPDRFFPYARIEVVDKPDPSGIGMTEKIFTGPLDKQLSDSHAYIRNYIIKEYVTKVQDHAEAVRVYNWPYRAIEEALSNAVYHRSYQEYEPITVTVTPEKLEILSLPGPDRSISDEDLEKCVLISSRYRNRRIGDFLKELKLIEGRNTGVPLIVREMEANGSGKPQFITDEDRTYFRAVLPVHPVFLESKDSEQTVSEEKNKKQVRRNRAEIVESVLDVLEKHGDMSMKELAGYLGYSGRSKAFREEVAALIKVGKVRYLIPDKPNSKNQKICLIKG
jgi:ATP-dependent DNA helicase RecG